MAIERVPERLASLEAGAKACEEALGVRLHVVVVIDSCDEAVTRCRARAPCGGNNPFQQRWDANHRRIFLIATLHPSTYVCAMCVCYIRHK